MIRPTDPHRTPAVIQLKSTPNTSKATAVPNGIGYVPVSGPVILYGWSVTGPLKRTLRKFAGRFSFLFIGCNVARRGCAHGRATELIGKIRGERVDLWGNAWGIGFGLRICRMECAVWGIGGAPGLYRAMAAARRFVMDGYDVDWLGGRNGGAWEALRGWRTEKRSHFLLRACAQTKPETNPIEPNGIQRNLRFLIASGVVGLGWAVCIYANEANGLAARMCARLWVLPASIGDGSGEVDPRLGWRRMLFQG